MGERPSVLMIGNFLSAKRGVRWVCEDIAARLALRGWAIITASSVQSRILRFLDMAWTTLRTAARYDIAHVEVYSGLSFAWAEGVCLLLQCLRKPLVLTLHGGNLPVFAKRWPGRVRRLVRKANVVTVPSGFLLNQMKPYRDDLLRLPNGIDVEKYPFRLRTTVTPTLVWIRAFHAIYNPQMAVHAVHRLKKRYPGVHLTMVGPDKGDGSLQATTALADRLGVADCIEFAGRVDKAAVPEWLDRGDIFLNTTTIDNAPVSVIEAWAAGCCVVSTNVGGIPWLLSDGSDALLVPPGDPEAMAAAVVRLIETPDLARTLSGRGRSQAEKFDWQGILSKWEQVYLHVAAGGIGQPEGWEAGNVDGLTPTSGRAVRQ